MVDQATRVLKALHGLAEIYLRDPGLRTSALDWLNGELEARARPEPIPFAFMREGDAWFLGRATSSRHYMPPRSLRFLNLARIAMDWAGRPVAYADLRLLDPDHSLEQTALCEARKAACEWLGTLPDMEPLRAAVAAVRVTKNGLHYDNGNSGFIFVTASPERRLNGTLRSEIASVALTSSNQQKERS
jgi:hypothetical protein